MARIDGTTALRAGATMVVVLVALGGIAALALPHSAFEDWGVVIGPLSWVVAALTATRFAGLGVREAALGSLAAVVPNVLAGLLGLHWIGVAAGVAVFALACGFLGPRQQ